MKQNALSRTVERGLTVSAEEAAAFPFDHTDILTASAMLNGATTPAQIADEVGLTPSAVRERLLDPVRCAWLSREVRTAVGVRLGNVLAALYARAIRTGDPRAVQLLLQQYGELLSPVERKVVDHRHMHVDLGQLSEDQLEKLIEDTNRKLNRKEPPIDVTPREGTEGAGAPGTAE